MGDFGSGNCDTGIDFCIWVLAMDLLALHQGLEGSLL